MIKKATTVEEQIRLLKERGMEIRNEDKAKESLLDIGYFRLGFYWFPFEETYPREVKRNHKLKSGTKFDYAIKLYYFDFDLRNLMLRYISRIEIHFRTTLIYYASNKYREDPFWYVNHDCVKKSFTDTEKFKNALKKVCKDEDVVKRDLKKYSREYAPAWKLIEYLSFGVVILLYENLNDNKLKYDISKIYGIESTAQFSSYINTIRYLRNCCAHGKCLFDMNLPKAINCSGPAGNLYTRKTKLSGSYQVLKYILGRISSNRLKEMENDLSKAFEKTEHDVVKDIIKNNSGFIEGDLQVTKIVK